MNLGLIRSARSQLYEVLLLLLLKCWQYKKQSKSSSPICLQCKL